MPSSWKSNRAAQAARRRTHEKRDNRQSGASRNGRDNTQNTKRKAIVIIDDDSDGERKKQKVTSGSSRAGGIIGDRLKDQTAKRALQQQESRVVDLTNDDDSLSKMEVCLGAIKFKARVLREPAPKPSNKKKQSSKTLSQMTKFESRVEGIECYLIDKKGRFATFSAKDKAMVVGVKKTSSASDIRFEFYVRLGDMTNKNWDAEIRVFAPRYKSGNIAKFFSRKQFFFQPPTVHTEDDSELRIPYGPQL